MGPASYGRQTKKGHESTCMFIADTCWKKFAIGTHFGASVDMYLDACFIHRLRGVRVVVAVISK